MLDPPEQRANENSTKVSAKERRRREAEARQAVSQARQKQEHKIKTLELEMLALEAEQAEISLKLEDPKTYEDAGIAVKINRRAAEIAEQLAKKSVAWETAVEAFPSKS